MSKKRKSSSSAVFATAPADDDTEHMLARSATQGSAHWYDDPLTQQTSQAPMPDLEGVKRRAAELYRSAATRFRSALSMTRADRDWFTQVTTRGTLRDRLTAYAMAVQDGPLYGLEWIEKVMEMAGGSNRHETLAALECATDILVGNDVLPRSRKLFYLHQRPQSCDETALLRWHFEDRLKSIFFSLLALIEKVVQDTIANNRERAARYLFQLARAAPFEQSSNSLRLLANKLGDPHKKLSSRIIYYLEELVRAGHDKEKIVEAVKEVVQRPGVPERAVYYGLTFLNQSCIINPTVAGIYTSMFKSTVVPFIVESARRNGKRKAREEAEAGVEPPRVCKAVLLGLTRLINDPQDAIVLGNELVEPLMKLSRLSNVGISLLSLSLLYGLSARQNTAPGVNRNIVVAQLVTVIGEWTRLARYPHSHPSLFALLEKIVNDGSIALDKIERLLKRLLNSALCLSSTFAKCALRHVAMALKERPGLKAMVMMPPDSAEQARHGCLYELAALAHHYDPIIRTMARGVAKGETGCTEEGDDVDAKAFMLVLRSLQGQGAYMREWLEDVRSKKHGLDDKKRKRGLEGEDDGEDDFEFDDEELSESDVDDALSNDEEDDDDDEGFLESDVESDDDEFEDELEDLTEIEDEE